MAKAKKELIAEAEELGLELTGKETNVELEKMIAVASEDVDEDEVEEEQDEEEEVEDEEDDEDSEEDEEEVEEEEEGPVTIKTTSRVKHDGTVHEAGESVTVPAEVAKRLCDAGVAKRVKAK